MVVGPAVHLGRLDIVIVGLFVAAIFALGFSARLRENTALQFIAAGRGLTLPVFVATLVSMWYGGILGVGETVSYFGYGAFVLIGVPYYTFGLMYAFVFARRVRTAEQISIPERLEKVFGKSAGLIGAVLVFLLAVPAAHVFMLGTLVQAISGWGLGLSVVIAAFVGTLFLYRGGLLADARVALLAFAMMYVGFGAIVGYCMLNYPISETFGKLPETMRSWDGGTGLPMVLSFLILGAWTLVDPGFHQRVAGAASAEVGQKGVIISVLCWLFFDTLSITAALYAVSLTPSLPENTAMIYPLFADRILPAGLKAVFFCGMIGTILSAMVGYALVSGATLGREGVCRLSGACDEAQQTRWSRVGIAFGCLVAVLLALKIQSVVQLWYSWAGAVVGALIIPVCLSYSIGQACRVRSGYVCASMILAFLFSFGWLVYGIRTGNPFLEVALVSQNDKLALIVPSASLDEQTKALVSSSTKASVGTLLPGLIVSGMVLGVGTMRKKRGDCDG